MDPLDAAPAPRTPFRARPSGQGERPPVVLLTALLLVMAAVLWWSVQPHGEVALAALTGSLLLWPLLAAAVRTARRIPPHRIGVVVVAGSLLLGVVALSAPPSTSNDSARYAWDGMVQKAGISPYSHVPLDEALAGIRPSWLFAPGSTDDDGRPTCAAGLFATEAVPTRGYPSGRPLCTAINRPNVPTIYPPTAELYFAGVRLAVPDGVGYLAFQLGGVLISLAVTLALLRALPRLSLPPHLAAVWAWSPLVLIEGVNNAHVDLLGGALLLAAGLLLTAGKPLRSGVMFGAAVAAKLIPAIAAPGLLFRRPVRFTAAAVGTFALLYLPYVLTAGWAVIGYLPGYLREEGYDSHVGIRFALAQFVSGGPWPMVLSAAALLLVALKVLRSTTEQNIWAQQTVMIGLTLLIVSPNYPWYALMLLPFIVLSRRWEYVGIIMALSIVYLLPGDPVLSGMMTRAGLLAAAAAVAAGAWWRRRAGLLASVRLALAEPARMGG